MSTNYANRVKLSAANSAAVGTSAVDLVPENQGRRYLRIQNAHATAKVGLSLDAGSTPAVATAGSITLGPGESIVFEDTIVPLNAIRAISDTLATPVTVWEN